LYDLKLKIKLYLTHTHIEENVSLSWGGELCNLWLSIQLILMKKAAKHGAIFSLCRHKIILPQPLPMFDIDNVSCLAVKLNCSHFFYIGITIEMVHFIYDKNICICCYKIALHTPYSFQ